MINAPVINASQAQVVFQNGADCAYTGIRDLSLDFTKTSFEGLAEVKSDFGRKLECVIDRYFHQGDFDNLRKTLEGTEGLFDRFTVSDLGLIPVIREIFPDVEIAISDYANCTNSTAAKVYSRLGCSTVILGLESTLEDIREVKANCPEIKTEVVVHGPVNMVYSGRSLVSTYFEKYGKNENADLTDLALEEESRTGIYYPFSEQNGATTIHETKDLCMISYLKDLVDCKTDSFRILGNNRGEDYLANVVSAYRIAQEALQTGDQDRFYEAEDIIRKTGARVKTTGFYV